MANVTLFDQTGKQAGEVVLNDAIFGIQNQTNLLCFDVIISQRASLRQGTHAVKNRSAVSGGGRKPWRQKELDVLVRFYPLSTMAWWWNRLRTNSTYLCVQTSSKSSSPCA